MARLNLKEIEERIEPLGDRDKYNRDFIYELLDVYGKPKSTIFRLRSGSINVAGNPNFEVALKSTLYFREVATSDDIY